MQEDPEESLYKGLSTYFEFNKEKDFENVKIILLDGINSFFEGDKDCYLEYLDIVNVLGDIDNIYNFKRDCYRLLIMIIASDLFPIIYQYLKRYSKDYEYKYIQTQLGNLYKEYIIRNRVKL